MRGEIQPDLEPFPISVTTALWRRVPLSYRQKGSHSPRARFVAIELLARVLLARTAEDNAGRRLWRRRMLQDCSGDSHLSVTFEKYLLSLLVGLKCLSGAEGPVYDSVKRIVRL